MYFWMQNRKNYVGDIYFCREYRLVCVQGQEITLTPKEFDILTILISHPMNVFTYKVIADLIWQNEYDFYQQEKVVGYAGKRDCRRIRTGV